MSIIRRFLGARSVAVLAVLLAVALMVWVDLRAGGLALVGVAAVLAGERPPRCPECGREAMWVVSGLGDPGKAVYSWHCPEGSEDGTCHNDDEIDVPPPPQTIDVARSQDPMVPVLAHCCAYHARGGHPAGRCGGDQPETVYRGYEAASDTPTRGIARRTAQRMADALGVPHEVRGPEGIERFEPAPDVPTLEVLRAELVNEPPPSPETMRFLAGRLSVRAGSSGDELSNEACLQLLFAADELERLLEQPSQKPAATATVPAESAEKHARGLAALSPHEEPIFGRFWGAVNIEGDDPTPLFLFALEVDAWGEIQRRQALPEEHDDRLSDDYQALSFDIEGIFWNHVDPNPRPVPSESRIWAMQCEIERLTARLEGLNHDRSSLDREALGRRVREVGLSWALMQPKRKASWMLTWEELTPEEREIDRIIGETIAIEALAARDGRGLAHRYDHLCYDLAHWSKRALDAKGEIEQLRAEHVDLQAQIAAGMRVADERAGELNEALLERNEGREEIKRMTPVVEAAVRFDEFDAEDDDADDPEAELYQAVSDYRNAIGGAS